MAITINMVNPTGFIRYEDVEQEAMTSDVTVGPAPGQYQLRHLRLLEAEAIHVIWEVAAEFERPVLLFSGARTPSSCCTWR